MMTTWIALGAWLAVSTAFLADGVLLIATLGHGLGWGTRQLHLTVPVGFTVLTFLLTPWRIWGLAAIGGAVLLHLSGHLLWTAALRRRTVPLAAPDRERLCADGQLGARAFHEVRVGDFGPAVVGLWRQTLVLPPAVLALPDGDLAVILAHEQAHAERHDSLKLWLAGIAGTLLCWHPLARMNLSGFRLQVELGADARAAARIGDLQHYALTLGRLGLALAQAGQPVRAGWGAALVDEPSDLLIRLETLTEPAPVAPVRQVRAPRWLRQALSRRGGKPKVAGWRARVVATGLLVWVTLGYLGLLLLALHFA